MRRKERTVEAKKLFDKGLSQAEKDEITGSVTSWRWAARGYHQLIPFDYERSFGTGRPKLLGEEPKERDGVEQAGYDSGQKRVLLCTWLSDKIGWKKYCRHTSESICSYTYSCDGPEELKTLHLLWEKDGLPEAAVKILRDTVVFEEYLHEEGRISRIDIWKEYHRIDEEVHVPYEFKYDEEGSLESIARIMDEETGRQEIVYKSPKGHSIPSLKRAYLASMTEELARFIASLAKEAPIQAVGIAYESYQWYSPPSVAVISKKELEGLGGGGKSDPGEIWNPVEFESYEDFEVEGAKLVETIAILNQFAPKSGDAEIKELYRTLGKKVKARLAKTAKVEKDLFVYATDLECSHLRENFEAMVPKGTLTRLRKAGLFPE